MEFVELSGIGKIKIRRNLNIKYLSLRIAPKRGIWVNVPLGASDKQVMKFLNENHRWIIENQKKIKVYEEDNSIKLRVGEEIKTKEHLFKIEETEKPHFFYKLEGKTITLYIPKKSDLKKIEKIAQHFLLDIYRNESRQYFPNKVKDYAEKFGFKYVNLNFRNNVSNWGSCSHENNISLNIKLMQMPDEIIDYVILHELCHTVEKNHSVDFWKLVGKVCPNYAVLRARLRKYNTRI